MALPRWHLHRPRRQAPGSQRRPVSGENLPSLYEKVTVARCRALYPDERSRFPGTQWIRKGNTILWNTFACGLVFTDGTGCSAIVHITGEQWNDMTLGSFKNGHTCTPYQLHRKAVAGSGYN